MEFEGDLETLVVGDVVTVAWTEDDFSDGHVPSEHLIKMSTLFVCLSAGFECTREIEWPQLLDDVSHVIVKITADDYRSIGVLSDNVSGDLDHPFRSFLQVLLFSGLEIAVENLNVFFAELELCPTEICAKCFH